MLEAGPARDVDPAAEHRRRRLAHGLDAGVQRHLLAAARVRARAVPGRARRRRGARGHRPGRHRRRRAARRSPHGPARSGTFHVVAGDDAPTARRLTELAARAFGAALPDFVAPGTAPEVEQRAGAFLPYFRVPGVFRTDAATRLGFAPPPLESYFSTLLRYADEARWGKACRPRWSLRRRAGGARRLTPPRPPRRRRFRSPDRSAAHRTHRPPGSAPWSPHHPGVDVNWRAMHARRARRMPSRATPATLPGSQSWPRVVGRRVVGQVGMLARRVQGVGLERSRLLVERDGVRQRERPRCGGVGRRAARPGARTRSPSRHRPHAAGEQLLADEQRVVAQRLGERSGRGRQPSSSWALAAVARSWVVRSMIATRV